MTTDPQTPVEEGEKECPQCGRVLSTDEFWRDANRPDGLRKKCRDCVNEGKRQWYEENKEQVAARRQERKPWQDEEFKEYRRNWQLENRYGITVDEFEEMATDQGHRCAICREPPSSNQKGGTLHVDHDHETGEVRGLLCNECNVGISNFEHDPERLREAAGYLEAS